VNNIKINSNSEKSLLNTLFNYIVPFLNNNHYNNFKKSNKDNLENKINDFDINKEKLNDILLLEQLILNNLKNSNNINKEKLKIKKQVNSKEIDIFDFIDNEKNIKNDLINENKNIDYSLSLTNTKEKDDEKGYSISIRYEENESEEKLKITVEVDDYGLNKLDPINKINKNNKLNDSKKLYSFSIKRKKDIVENKSYSIKIAYEDNYEQERLTINYKSAIRAYLDKREQALTDFSDRVPGKNVHIFSESQMPGVLGFTYLGDNYMALRADLTGDLKKMVDIHESIHTPDEYETRVLTDWIMSKEKMKYVK